jgi:hypothetical protein
MLKLSVFGALWCQATPEAGAMSRLEAADPGETGHFEAGCHRGISRTNPYNARFQGCGSRLCMHHVVESVSVCVMFALGFASVQFVCSQSPVVRATAQE